MFKPIPEDTGSFLKIRTAKPQMLYVDKTAYLPPDFIRSLLCLSCAPQAVRQVADDHHDVDLLDALEFDRRGA